MHGKVSANQIDTTNQKQTNVQTLTANTNSNNNGTSGTDNNTNTNNNNQTTAASTQTTTDTTATPVAASAQTAANTNTTATASNQTNNSGNSANTSATATTDKSNTQQKATYDTKDNGNYAALDSATLNTNGQLKVSGWHTTNDAKDKTYHYIIILDQNNKEIGRQNITDQSVTRDDIQKIHNLYGADQSGFNTQFDLSKVLGNTTSIRVVSRYTTDKAGNGTNPTDYWFAPITVDRKNYGHIDNVYIDNDQLVVEGWNATNQAANKPYHTISLVDQTTGKTLATQVVTNPVARPDVAKAYSQIDGAGNSGFSVRFSMSGVNLSHKLQVVSSYASSKNSNDNVNYYFTPITTGNYDNQANLDSFDYSNGKTLTVYGWHADDISKLESNHFLILFDNTANKQVAVVKANAVARPDITKAFPSFETGGQSGFQETFDLSGATLTAGHSYTIVSRYSTSSTGNGDTGQYTDYWLNPVTLNQKLSHIDGIKMTSDGLQINGWMASDYSITRPYAYAIVLNDGKEVARQRLTLTYRPDIVKAFPYLYNGANSGFNTTIKLDPSKLTGSMQVLLRFTDDVNGNGDVSDQYSQNYATSDGAFDNIDVLDNSIYVSGWHASDQTKDKPYQYLIFIDTTTGKEIYRQQVTDINRTRTDVGNYEPAILNSGTSGYQLGFTLPSSLNHHTVRIIHRYTDDVNGNGNYVDLWSNPVSIHNNRWAWPFPADGEGHFTGGQLFGVHAGGEFRQNGFHDGLDFGSYDHPGTQVHAIHSGTIVGVGYTAGLDWYVLEDTGEYLIVYQEAFSSRSNITVTTGQKIEVGDVIGNRDTSHVHIGITRQHNFNIALAKSFTNDGTWLDPLEIIRNGLNG